MGIGSSIDQAERERIAAREKEEADRKVAKEKAEQDAIKASPWAVEPNMSAYDKKAVMSKDEGLHALTGGELDNVQRRETARHAEAGSAQAKEWIAQDQKALEASDKASKRDAEADRRSKPSYIEDAKDHYLQAREKRIAHMENQPAFFQVKLKKTWAEQRDQLTQEEQSARHVYKEHTRKASPETIEALRNSAQSKLQEAEKAIQARNKIAPMASDQIKKQGLAFNAKEHFDTLATRPTPRIVQEEHARAEQNVTETMKQGKRHTQQ